MGLLDKLFGGKQTAEPAPPRQEDVADLLSKANACIDKGDFAEAARILENVKRVQPQRVSARVNYAYCLLNLDRRLQAQDELQACLELEPKNIDALYMLSGLQAEDQDWLSVSRHLQTLLQVKPDFAFAYPDLAKALFHLGEYTQALDISNAGLKQQPQDMALLLGKGNIHFARYDLDEAMACFDEVLKQQPDNLQAIHNKALVFDRLDQPQKALEFSEQAYTKTPSDLAFLSTYARCLVRVGRVEEGRFLVDQGLGKYPANPDLLLSAATYYDIEGNHEEAIIYLDRLLSKNPRHLEALQHKNLALYSLRSYQAAVACARKAIEYHPNAAICWNLLGSSLHKQGYMEEAESAYRRALELKPDFINSLGNLGCIYRERGRLDEAVEYFGKVLEIRPNDINSHGNRLYCMAYQDGADTDQYIEQARQSDLILNSEVLPYTEWKTGPSASALSGKLRVGFVSGDFLRHPVGYFFETTLKHLDRDRFELFAYPTISFEDELTKRIKPLFNQWQPIVGMTDVRVAERIRDDAVHLLIDLAGFSAGNRLSIFPYKAAPVQATWLGFFASTGMRSIDYILVDPHGVRPDEQHLFSEKLCFLPETRLCFTPPTDKPVSTLPALTAGHVNMACYQDVTKLNTRVLDCWRRILEALPECRFVMMSRQNKDPVFRQSLRERLQEAGLDVDRVHIQEPLTYSEYLESYSKIDFMLDTFPYTGGTTTCEALWMGVPTVTLCGHTLLARQGAGLLACAGLNDWVANSEDEYVALAVKKAGDVQALARTRATLREMAAKTSLFDGQRFAAQLGAAFEAMWRGEV